MPDRIPIAAVKRFGKENNLQQVIVLAWDGGLSHVVTWGLSVVDCDQAAQGGDLLKSTMGWPYDPTCIPSRVKALKDENAKLRARIKELESL